MALILHIYEAKYSTETRHYKKKAKKVKGFSLGLNLPIFSQEDACDSLVIALYR